MVFERFKLSLLRRQLRLAKGVTKKQQARAKSNLATIKKKQDKREDMLRERLKIQDELDSLRDQIKKAKQIKLSPVEKKTLERKIKDRKARDEKIAKTAAKIGDGIFKSLKVTANFIEQIDKNLSEPARRPKKMKRKPTRKKKSSRNRSKSVKRKSKR